MTSSRARRAGTARGSCSTEGLLDVPADGGFGPVAAAFAIHITARYSTGTINFRPGPIYAAGDRFTITVRGAGGHASSPHLALDPVPIAAEIVLALQTVRSRRINTFDPLVLTVGSLTSGTAPNIIPETAVLRGTVRTTSDDVRERAHELIRQIPTGIAAAHGATAEVEISSGYPATINDEEVAALVTSVGAELFGEERVVEMPWPSMGSEDFSYILQRVPGCDGVPRRDAGRPRPGDGPPDALEQGRPRRIGDADRRRAPRRDGGAAAREGLAQTRETHGRRGAIAELSCVSRTNAIAGIVPTSRATIAPTAYAAWYTTIRRRNA